MKIYAIGDSHALFAFNEMPDVKIYSEPSITMYRVIRDRHIPLDIPIDGLWLFCHGEVDARCHITRQRERGREEDEIIDTLVKGYIETLEDIQDTRKCEIGIMSIIPPTRYPGIWSQPSPTLRGTDEERSRYVRKMNYLLKRSCDDRNWIYFDVYSEYADKEGMLPPEFADTSVHLRDNSKVRVLLEKLRNEA